MYNSNSLMLECELNCLTNIVRILVTRVNLRGF